MRGERRQIVKPSLSTASMPPASKKLLANVARGVKSAGRAQIGEEALSAARLLSPSMRVGASRSASNGAARRSGDQRLEFDLSVCRSRDRRRRLARARSAAASLRLGNSLVPVSASLRRAMCLRALHASRRPCAGSRCRKRGERAAGRLDLLKQCPCRFAKLLRQRLDRRRSRRPGRRPCARLDSSSRISCVLRATRRAKHRAGRAPACAAAP